MNAKECLICKTTLGLHRHHIFFGSGIRPISEKYDATVWLCGKHHNLSNEGVHFNTELDLRLKKAAQIKLMQKYGWNTEEFIKVFKRNYL